MNLLVFALIAQIGVDAGSKDSGRFIMAYESRTQYPRRPNMVIVVTITV